MVRKASCLFRTAMGRTERQNRCISDRTALGHGATLLPFNPSNWVRIRGVCSTPFLGFWSLLGNKIPLRRSPVLCKRSDDFCLTSYANAVHGLCHCTIRSFIFEALKPPRCGGSAFLV